MNVVLRFFISLSFFVFGASGLVCAQTTTWTGSVSTDWDIAGNWTAGVPLETSDVIIPNVTNKPVISTANALALSVQVVSGGLLTIAATGSLTISDTYAYQAIWNQGTVENNGIITIGNVSGTSSYGIKNESVFNNNLAAQINIDNTLSTSLYNISGTFTNAGTITIGANNAAAFYAIYGIQNEGGFINNTSGQINIDGTTLTGFINAGGGMTSNTGNITLGANTCPGSAGLQNSGSFFNNTGGHIRIDRTTGAAFISDAGDLTNSGNITIGANYDCQSGVVNMGTFKNELGGQIAVDRVMGTGLLNYSGAFTNAGNIAMGGIACAGFYAIMNLSTFENEAGGQINIDTATSAALANTTGTFNNAGFINIGANLNSADDGIDNNGSFNNKTGGQINIDRVTTTGINNSGGGTNAFTNQGIIKIGALSAGGGFDMGIDSYNTFNNNTGGQINIDRVNDAITGGPFNNAGTVTVGALTNVPYLIAPGGSTFRNNTGGVLNGSGIISSLDYANAGGILAPGTPIGSMVFDGGINLSNTKLSIEITGAGTPGTNFDLVTVQGTATMGGDLIITTPGFTMSPGQSFLILDATSTVMGTFASVTWPAGVTGTVTYGATTVTLNVLTVLPLTLVEFSGNATGNRTALEWKTADEVNTAAFDIERSSNGINYTTIGTVKAIGQGANSYNTTDETPVAGNNYYRLKMKDLDGKFKVSRVVVVKHAEKDGLQLSPVPASSYVTVQLKDQSLLNQRAQVYNSVGYLVTEVMLTNGVRINMTGWAAGMYTIKTSTASYRFVKQ